MSEQEVATAEATEKEAPAKEAKPKKPRSVMGLMILGKDGQWSDVDTSGAELGSSEAAVRFVRDNGLKGRFRVVSIRKDFTSATETKTVVTISDVG